MSDEEKVAQAKKYFEETNRLLLLYFNAFTRRVMPEHIIPTKKPWIQSRHGITFLPDDSPEGNYACIIVPKTDYDKVFVLVPEAKFTQLLETWKQQNPKIMKNVDNIVKSDLAEREKIQKLAAMKRRVLGEHNQ